MLQKKYLIIGGSIAAIIILAVAGVLLYPFFKSLIQYGSLSGDFSKAGQPVNVKLVLDNNVKSTANIGSSGGDVALKDQNVNLNLPKGALNASQNITATKISALNGLPSGWKLVSGYSFEPSGLVFGKPAMFTANSMNTDNNVYAFVIENGELQRVPYFIKGNQAQVGISGFSGVAFIQITGGQVPFVSNDHSVENRAVEIIGQTVSEDYRADPTREGLSASAKIRSLKILQIWYTNSVKPHLQDAAKDPAKIKDSGREYAHWLASAMVLGMDNQLTQQISEGKQLLADALKNALSDASKKCKVNGDATQLADMLEWESLAMVLGVENQPGLTSADLNNYMKSCAHFELDFTSTFSDNNGNRADASGKADLALTDDMKISGSGTMTEDSVTLGRQACTGGMIGRPFALKVPPTPLNVTTGASPSGAVSLQVNIDQIADAGASSPGYTCGGPDALDMAGGGSWWVVEWALTHKKDEVAGTSLTTNIPDWQYVGKNGVFVRKTFESTTHVSLFAGLSSDITEKTVFTLKTTPQ